MSDDRTEDNLRRVLSVEAEQVQPAGDGLSRIQQRVTARQLRMRWLRPALAGGAAVIVLGGAVGGYAIATSGNNNQTVNIGPADGSPGPDVSGYPTGAIFPFTTAAQESSWETEYAGGHSPWIADPTAVTQSWIESYLKQNGHFDYSASTDAGSSDVTVSRKVEGNDHGVTVVHLTKFDHAWLVTGASDPNGDLAFSTPAAGDSVTSPLTVSGPGYGVDEVASVQVRNATTPDLLGQANTAGFGNGTPQWSATVPFTPISDAGVVVVTVASAADGGVSTLAAEKVTFGSSSPATSTAPAYGVQGGTIVKLNPATGDSVGPVAGVVGTVFEVRQFGDHLYYTVRVGDCLPTLYSVPLAGGTPTAVASAADSDYGIVGFDVSADGTKLTYLESSGCHQSMAGKGKLVFERLTDGTTRSIDFPSEPPAIIGDPIWEADGIHVDAFVRTGMQGYLARYDSTSGNSMTPSTNACPGFDINTGMPGALTEGPGGTLWVATETGSSMQVLSCTGTTPTVEFTVPGNATPQSLAVNSEGKALLTDTNGNLYSWSGSQGAKAEELIGGSGVTSATW